VKRFPSGLYWRADLLSRTPKGNHGVVRAASEGNLASPGMNFSILKLRFLSGEENLASHPFPYGAGMERSSLDT